MCLGRLRNASQIMSAASSGVMAGNASYIFVGAIIGVRTKMYDAFPAITPDEAADMICDALRTRPKHMGTRLGTFGEVAYALSPKAVDRILHLAYRVFPDSAASKGQKNIEERASFEQIAMATLTRGVHW